MSTEEAPGADAVCLGSDNLRLIRETGAATSGVTLHYDTECESPHSRTKKMIQTPKM